MARDPDVARIPDALLRPLAERLAARGEAIAVGSRGGLIEWTNAAWRRVTGWALEDVVDKPVAHLLDRIGLEHAVLEFVDRHFALGEGCALELSIEGADGVLRAVHLEVEPLRDAGGEIDRFVAIATERAAAPAEAAAGPSTDAAAPRPRASTAPAEARGPSREADAFTVEALDALREIDRLCLEIERTTRPGLLDELGVRSVRARALRAGDRANALLARAARGAPPTTRLDLTAATAAAVARAAADWPAFVHLDASIDDEVRPVAVDPVGLAAGLDALIRLAAEAIEDGWGTVSVTTGTTSPGRPLEAAVHYPSYAGALHETAPRAWLELHDTGTTLPTEALRRIRAGALPVADAPRVAGLAEACARLRAAGLEVDLRSIPGRGNRVLLLAPLAPA